MNVCIFIYSLVLLFVFIYRTLYLFLSCREVNHGQQLKDDMAYIKKPPNAFMLFLEEQRPYVAPELRRQGTSKVNKALGKKVSVLEKLCCKCGLRGFP